MFYCVGLGPPDDPSQGVKQSVGVCNCVLFIIDMSNLCIKFER